MYDLAPHPIQVIGTFSIPPQQSMKVFLNYLNKMCRKHPPTWDSSYRPGSVRCYSGGRLSGMQGKGNNMLG